MSSPTTVLHFPLQEAYLCTECNMVSNCATRCVCGAEQGILSLSAALNRPAVDTDARIAARIGRLDEAMDEGKVGE